MKSSEFLLAAACVVALSGCANFSFTKEKVEYDTSTTRAPLLVPPGLDAVPVEDRYEVPERPSVYASAHAQQKGTDRRAVTNQVLPEGDVATVMREGDTRWVRVKLPAQEAWTLVTAFWPSVGLNLEKSNASLGTMQTVWAENKANLPNDIIRQTFGKLLDVIYSTGERDQYRTRLERIDAKTTDVYVTHRSMVEVVVKEGGDQQSTKWQLGPSDATLEAEMLTRLSQNINAQFGKKAPSALSAEHVNAVKNLSKSQPRTEMSHVVTAEDGQLKAVVVHEGYEKAWRRLSLALDRLGFEIEDRDRNSGAFYVRYLDENYEKKQKDSQGFWSKFTNSQAPVDPVKYVIVMRPLSNEQTQVAVLDEKGQEDKTGVAPKILQLIYSQVR